MRYFAPLRHCLRPSKWRVRRSAGRNCRLYGKLRYSSEPPLDAESKLCTHVIVAQPARELQPDFTSIPPLPKLEQLIAPNFLLLFCNINARTSRGLDLSRVFATFNCFHLFKEQCIVLQYLLVFLYDQWFGESYTWRWRIRRSPRVIIP